MVPVVSREPAVVVKNVDVIGFVVVLVVVGGKLVAGDLVVVFVVDVGCVVVVVLVVGVVIG